MKMRTALTLLLSVLVLCCGVAVGAADLPGVIDATIPPAAAPAPAPATVSAPALTMQGVLAWLWAQANSSAGLTFIAGLWAWVLARVFTWKPAWKRVYEDKKPLLLQAVKAAEKEIPDNTPNKALARLDAALRFAIAADASLGASKAATEDLKQALSLAHADAEGAGNI